MLIQPNLTTGNIMADGPGGQMSYRAMEAEHERRMRRTHLIKGEVRRRETTYSWECTTEVELFQTGGNYTDRSIGWVIESIADELIRRYNENTEGN